MVVKGTNGYEIVVFAEEAERGSGAKTFVEILGANGAIKAEVPARSTGEVIRANFGSYGRINMRWVPDGGVREVTGTCKPGLQIHRFFVTGSFVGTLRIRGGSGFTEATTHRIRWQAGWYGKHTGCPGFTSEGFPGPGVMLEAGGTKNFWEPVHLTVIENGPGKRVEYQARAEEKAGRMKITRYAFASGGPKTLDVAPGFRDHTELPLTGASFEATLHSGFREVEE